MCQSGADVTRDYRRCSGVIIGLILPAARFAHGFFCMHTNVTHRLRCSEKKMHFKENKEWMKGWHQKRHCGGLVRRPLHNGAEILVSALSSSFSDNLRWYLSLSRSPSLSLALSPSLPTPSLNRMFVSQWGCRYKADDQITWLWSAQLSQRCDRLTGI